jgi:hypothetical protein
VLTLCYEYEKEREFIGKLAARLPGLFGKFGFQVICTRPGTIAAYGAGYGGTTAMPVRDVGEPDWELVAATLSLALATGDEATRQTALGFYDDAAARQAAHALRPAAYNPARDD